MRLLFLLFLIAATKGKIIVEKWEMQSEQKFGEVKHNIKDSLYLSVDAYPHVEADDVVVSSQ